MRKAALHFLTFVLPGLLLSYGTGNTGDQPATDQDERTFITDFKILAMRARPWKRSTWNDTRRLQNLKALDLAHQAGIQILTIDMRMMPFTQEKVAILCLKHTLWISEPISLFGHGKGRLEYLYVCDIEMSDFKNTLTFRQINNSS